jgi:MSHA pilin protein MshA
MTGQRLSIPPRRGFTMVELVMVVVILGILAAVALPRFADLQGGARASKVKAMAGSIRTAAALVRASALAAGVSCNADTASAAVTVEGVAIDLNYCYPQALSTGAGILGAANVNGAIDGVVISGGGAAAGSVVTLQISGATDPTQCAITYQSPSSQQRPVVTEVSSGC